jgi:shikimate kinase
VKKNLILLGMMAAGKTTLGRIIAEKQKLEFIDTDLNIERKNSMKIKDIFKKKGEVFFRTEEEKEVLKSLKKNNCVIALGGGAFINKNLRNNILKNAISFWLNVNIKTLERRSKWNQKRPLLINENSKQTLSKLYIERKNIYKLANHKIECDKLSKESIVKKIIMLYEKH